MAIRVASVLHGLTAPWGAERYGRWYEATVVRRPGIREAAEPLIASGGRR